MKKKKCGCEFAICIYLFWLIVLLFLEYAFRLFMSIGFSFDGFVNIVLYSCAASSVLSIITTLFKEKANKIITGVLLFLIGVLFNVQLVFFKIFKTYFSLSNLALGDQAASFAKDALIGILQNIIFILVLLLPFILLIVFKKKIIIKKNGILAYVSYLVILLASIGLFYLNMNVTKGEVNSTYHLYYDVNEIALNIDKLGVMNSYRLDLKRTIFGFEQDIVEENYEEEETKVEEEPVEEVIVYTPNTTELNLDKATSNAEIKKINSYIKTDAGTLQNEYTGLFKDYNLVFITAESFSEIAVDEKLTPTLYKLTHNGFVFKNYYTPYVLSTIGGEFQALTGLYPDNSILPKWRQGTNYFPYGLAKVFREKGYKTFAYHNNSYGFQDRHKYLKSQGFTNFLACWNGMEKRINCRIWPQSDNEMMQKTVTDYVNSDKPFLAYYMTVSGHFQYNFKGDNSMCKRHQAEVKGMKGTESARAYVATQIELDLALDTLIKELDKKGKLDNTVFVLLADHYPYALSLNDVNSISSYKRDNIVEVNHNNLILWNNAMETVEVDKVGMSVDVLPTVMNLFGIEYDSRLMTGRDLLSDSEGLAIMKNRSWVTDKGTYFAANGKFVPKEGAEIDDNYVKRINSVVTNRLNIARLIVKDDYYKYLMK